jgi:hypothetical protein
MRSYYSEVLEIQEDSDSIINAFPYRTLSKRISDEDMIIRGIEDPRYVAFGNSD